MSTTPTTATPASPSAAPARKKHRIFMWFFLALQLVFILLIVLYGIEQTGPTAAQIASFCGHGQWQGVFTSYHDCVVHGANGLNAAGHVGQAIGIVMVVVAWVAADIILGIGRLIVLSSRKRSS
jgi:hypothetical protein